MRFFSSSTLALIIRHIPTLSQLACVCIFHISLCVHTFKWKRSLAIFVSLGISSNFLLTYFRRNILLVRLQNSGERLNISVAFRRVSTFISVVMQQHMPRALQDVSSPSDLGTSASAGDKSSCISVILQDECRPLKKRWLHTDYMPALSSMVVHPPSTRISSGKNGTVDAFGCHQKVDVKRATQSVQAERVNLQSVDAPQPTMIDLEALTYYPPHTSPVRNVTINGAISTPPRQCTVKFGRRYKCVRFSLSSWCKQD